MPWERIFEWWPIYRQYESEERLKKLYAILSAPENVEKMINANDNMDKPPVVGLQSVIENGEVGGIISAFDIENNKNLRRLIGAMIGEILYDYGYRPKKQKNISQGGSRYFKSATHYELIDSLASKKLQKEIAIESSGEEGNDTTPAGGLVRKAEYTEKIERFRKFWKKYDLIDRIKAIFLSLDITRENQSYASLPMVDYSSAYCFETSIFPCAEQLGRYSASMYLDVFQIASLLESRYPGIIELSGLPVLYSRNPSIFLCESDFITMLSELLAQESSVFENATLSKNYVESCTTTNGCLNHTHYAERKDIPIFRLRNGREDLLRDLVLKEYYANYCNEISEAFFKTYDVMENILRILKKNTAFEREDGPLFYNLYQIIAALSQKHPINSHYYPVACVYFELMKRIFKGNAPEIKLMIWPGNTNFQISYRFKFKDDSASFIGTANYTPLFAWQSTRAHR